MKNLELEQSMLKTLMYFASQNHPLTREEWYAWLWCPPAITYPEFCDYIESQNKSFWINVGGYYTLPNYDNAAKIRGERVVACTRHLRRANRAARLLRLLPYVRMVVVGNSVGAFTADTNSDIDFLVVTATGRVWTVRFFANFILRLFHLRTYGIKRAGRICLSFFVDEKNLNMGNWRAVKDDIYLIYWLCQLVPIYDPHNLFVRLLGMNSWIVKYVPHISLTGTYTQAVRDIQICSVFKKITEHIWDKTLGYRWEWLTRSWQIRKMKPEIRGLDGGRDRGVILGCGVIKLHDHDARLTKREEWVSAVQEYLKTYANNLV